MTSIARRSAAFTAHEKPTTGDTKMSFVGVDHLGWMKCDGRSLPTTTYNLLFQVLGYTFGGSGTTFQLPNPAGRVLGVSGTVTDDDGQSRTFAPGNSLGELQHLLTVNEMPSHNHDISTASPGTNANGASGNTSTNATGITATNSGTAAIQNPAHSHNFISQQDDFNNSGPSSGTNYNLNFSGPTLLPGQTALALPSFPKQDNGVNLTWANAVQSATTAVYDSGHTHTITDPQHRHQLNANGGNQFHNNIQPSFFYGNLFVYSGIPVTPGFPPNPAAIWPPSAAVNPPLI